MNAAVLVVVGTVGASVVDLHLGGIFPMTAAGGGWAGGQACQPAAEWALRDVNADPTLLPGYRLKLMWNNSEVDARRCIL